MFAVSVSYLVTDFDCFNLISKLTMCILTEKHLFINEKRTKEQSICYHY